MYGGGGIVPDIFVPLDTLKFNHTINRLYNSGALNSFAYEYADLNRDAFLRKYKNASQFVESFQVSTPELNALRKYLFEKKLNTEFSGKENGLALLLKALIGRTLFDKDAYYPILYSSDNAILKAIDVLTGSKQVVKK